jgi:hypothetical protein
MKRPSFQFYPKEWIWDLALRRCSVGARGVWADLLCLMHEGVPYGHLADERGALPLDFVLRIVGISAEGYAALLAELEAHGVFSRTDTGIVFSRRMVRDEERRATLAANGRRGGRPTKTAAVTTFPDVHPNTEADWDAEEAFEELWAAYPAKGRVRRIEAQHAFVDKIRNRAVFTEIMEAVRGKFARSEKWSKGFVMALPSWIRQESWSEDPEPDTGQEARSVYRKWEPPKA